MQLRATRLTAIASAVKRAIKAFSPAQLFGTGAPGVWYDPSDFDRYINQLGPELVTNGMFDTDVSGWTIYANTLASSVSGEAFIQSNESGGSGIWQDFSGLTSTKTYVVTGTFRVGTGTAFFSVRQGTGSFGPVLNSTTTTSTTSVSYKFVVSGQTGVRVYLGAINIGQSGYFDNISVKELTALDTATLFQDSAGTTPVTAVEQPVGLMLDKSQGLVLGSEICPNGTFDTATGWVLTTGTIINGGKLNFLAALPNNPNAYIALTGAASGDVYSITFTITDYVAGSVGVVLYSSGVVSPKYSANGTYTFFLAVPVSNGNFGFVAAGASTTLSIDNVSVKKVLGNHAFQATSASRPVLSARYNLLTKTEQFDDAAWTKQEVTLTANATTSPIGGSNGTSIVPTATTNQFRIYRNPDPSVSAQNGIYVKANGYTKVALRDAGGTSGMYAAFDLASVSVINPGSSANASIVSAGNGWFKISAVFTTAANQRFSLHVLSPSYVSGVVDVTWTANGTSGIYIWGASLVPANQSTLPYQRVNTATDYATTGFLPYLKFDGVDDSLSTNSISFTATDKMSVFAGVRKLSDAALGVLVELGNWNVNVNGFDLFAPNNSTNYSAGLLDTLGRYPALAYSTYAAPITNVVSSAFDRAAATVTTQIASRINGGAVTGSSNAQPAVTNSAFGALPLYIGRRNNATFPFNGQLYSMIIVGKAVTAGELSSTETYVNSKTKAY